MPNLPETRASLLIRLRDRRNSQAWSEFVDIYEPLIHRLARRQGLQDADACDLTQQVLMAVAAKVETWDPNRSKGSFRAWVSQVARNLTVNMLVSRRRHPLGTGDSNIHDLLNQKPATTAEDTAAFDAEYRRRIFHYAAEQVRKEFRAKTWAAFWDSCVEGQRVQEVARRLGMSVGAVYIARSRVLARLRQRIQQIEETH